MERKRNQDIKCHTKSVVLRQRIFPLTLQPLYPVITPTYTMFVFFENNVIINYDFVSIINYSVYKRCKNNYK